MHRALLIAAAVAAPAAAQEFTYVAQFRAIAVETYAADFDGFIVDDDLVKSIELFNFNENLFVEAELGGAAAVAEASQTSLLDPTFVEVTSDMFTEAIAEGEEADASSYVENVGFLTFSVDQPVTVTLAGFMTIEGGESSEMTIYLFDKEGPLYIVGIGGGETIEFDQRIDLSPGEYELVNELFAEGLRKEEAISSESVFSLSIAGGCAADVNGDGSLDILDFVAYQGLFVNGDPNADCNDDGDLNILDFVCYQNLFQQGCG